MRIAVIQFPGSNADWDALHVARDVLGADAFTVFHKETELGDVDAVIIPGGFSYGDYLRPGAIARFSPITAALSTFAKAGGPILGICNGFQILTEMHLLPGALTRNANLRFECRDVYLRREGDGVFSSELAENGVLRLPIAHADGRYQCSPETFAELEGEGRIAFRYCDPSGAVPEETGDEQKGSATPTNPNGSIGSIAGIYDKTGRVLGLMPHPERASEPLLSLDGRADGLALFESLRTFLEGSSRDNRQEAS